MISRWILRSQARADITEQQNWYLENQAFDAAERFTEAIADVLQDLLTMPLIGRSEEWVPSSQQLRSIAIPGFEALRLYYVIEGDDLVVIRLLHGSRDVRGLFRVGDSSHEG